MTIEIEKLEYDDVGFSVKGLSIFFDHESNRALVVEVPRAPHPHESERQGYLPLESISPRLIDLEDDYGEIWAQQIVAFNPFDQTEKLDKEFWAARPVSDSLRAEVEAHNATPWVESKEYWTEYDHSYEGDGMRGSRTETYECSRTVWVAPDGRKTINPKRNASDDNINFHLKEWNTLKRQWKESAEQEWLARWESEIQWEEPEPEQAPPETPWSKMLAVCENFRHHKYEEHGQKLMLAIKAIPSRDGDLPGWQIATYARSSGWANQKPIRILDFIEVFDLVFFEDEDYRKKAIAKLQKSWNKAIASLAPLASGKPRPIKR